ncbi:MAG: FtsQ-type POTRA domain-containing protein [Alphaproteobacteria bacterium]|nr:MAG: FtsQ-type POTRA domain-containing protein [Alphaproteobacteria bacterium]
MPSLGRNNKKKTQKGRHAARKSASSARAAGRLKNKNGKGRSSRAGVGGYWRRRWTDFRVRLDESRKMALFVGLSLLTIASYIAWATGVFVWAGQKIDQGTERALIAGGFSIQQVQVEGRNKTDLEALKAALGVERGSSILHYDTDMARERVEKLDWVSAAQVIRFLPNTIHVVIVERSPIAIWQLQKQLHLIDRSGTVVGEASGDAYLRLPLVVGPGAAKDAAKIFDLMDQYPELKSQIDAYVRIGERRWNLRLKSGMDIQLPAEREDRALAKLVAYDEEHHLLTQAIEVIDMRLPDRIYLKLVDDKAAKIWPPGTET